MKPLAGWALASNQLYMYLYPLFYALLLQRPKDKRIYKKFGLALPIYLLVGIANAVINLILSMNEQTEGTTFN